MTTSNLNEDGDYSRIYRENSERIVIDNDEEETLRKEVRCMKIKDIKTELTSLGISLDGLLEKNDLVNALCEYKMNMKRDGHEGNAQPDENEEKKRRESILFSSARRSMSSFATRLNKDKTNGDSKAPILSDKEEEEDWIRPDGFFTTLQHDDDRKNRSRWEKNAHLPVSDALMGRLLKNSNFTRTKRQIEKDKPVEKLAANNIATAPSRWIKGALKKIPNRSKNGDVVNKNEIGFTEDTIKPMFDLIGVDVFRTTEENDTKKLPEKAICKQDALVRSGLRNQATFVMNFMTPFANIVIYFKMPNWIKNFHQIVENESDPPDMKALKRFLRGSADYRNTRLQLYASAIKVPLELRVVAPSPKKELTLLAGTMPLLWRQGNEKYGENGKVTKHALLELDCNISSDPTSIQMARLMQKFLKRTTGDIAVVIGELPELDVVKIEKAVNADEQLELVIDGVDESKPSSCLGLVRLDRIDVDKAAVLPD